jgi:glutamate N-acetyltransferase/amino-acid N-acetyltransferase
MRICIGEVPVFDGAPLAFDEALATAALREPTVVLALDLAGGQGSGTAWGCDLTAEYVAINSEYTT